MNFFTVLFSVFLSIQQAFIQLVPTIQPKSSWNPRHVKPLAHITIENCLSCRSIHTHTWVELVQSSHSHMPQWVLQRLSSSHSKVRWPIVKHQKRTLLESDLKKSNASLLDKAPNKVDVWCIIQMRRYFFFCVIFWFWEGSVQIV